MKTFTANHEQMLGPWDKVIKDIMPYLQMLEDFGYTYEEEDESNFWMLVQYPVEIKIAVKEGSRLRRI